MNVTLIEKPAFPAASTDRVFARFRLLGIGAVSTERSSRLDHRIATVSPYFYCETLTFGGRSRGLGLRRGRGGGNLPVALCQ